MKSKDQEPPALLQKEERECLYCRQTQERIAPPSSENSCIEFFYFFSSDQRGTQLLLEKDGSIYNREYNIWIRRTVNSSLFVTCQTSLWWLPCFHCTWVWGNDSIMPTLNWKGGIIKWITTCFIAYILWFPDDRNLFSLSTAACFQAFLTPHQRTRWLLRRGLHVSLDV